MRGRTVRYTVPLIIAAATLAACGTTSSGGAPSGHNQSTVAPKTEFTDAFHALGQGNALTMTLNLGTTGADLLRIGGLTGGSGGGPTPAEANAIAGDHISIELMAPSGKTISAISTPAQSTGAKVAVTLGDASHTYFSLLEVNKSLYAQVDLKYFFGISGKNAQYAAVQREVSKFPAFVKAAVAGQWVSLSAATLKSFEGFAQGELRGKIPTTSKLLQLHGTLIATLINDLTVIRASSGTTDHLVLSANLRKVLTDEYSDLRPIIASFASIAGSTPKPDFSQIPATIVHLDAYVTSGALSKLSLDAGQFDKKQHFSLPIQLTFTRSGAAINAPSSSTPIDFSSIGQLIGAAEQGSSGSGGI